MSHRVRSLFLVLVVVLAACGDDDGGATTVTTGGSDTTATTTAPPAPTELRFTFDAITGVSGKILVATVFAEGASGVAGTACLPADADPFSGSAVVKTSAPDNPCGFDSPYGVLLTTEGAFSYFVAAYAPGTQITEVCAQGDVTVDGPTEVVITAADLTGANCTG